MKELITICIPTRDNLPTIKIVLNALNYQNIYPKILIIDNGSKDGTLEALQTIIKNKIFPDLNIELINFGEWSGDRNKNIERMRYEFCQKVETKYLFFLDSDVLIPPYILEGMLNTMEKQDTLGMLGLRYDYNATHVKIGASLLRTELAKRIKWIIEENKCECLFAAQLFQSQGYRVEEYNVLGARHLLAL